MLPPARKPLKIPQQVVFPAINPFGHRDLRLDDQVPLKSRFNGFSEYRSARLRDELLLGRDCQERRKNASRSPDNNGTPYAADLSLRVETGLMSPRYSPR